MFVDVADIGPAGRQLSATLHLPPLEGDAAVGDLRLAPVALQGRAVRLGVGYGVQGRFQTSVDQACSRCLEPFRLPLDLTFDLVYRSPGSAVAHPEDRDGSAEGGEGGDPAVTDLEDDGRIDVVALVREQIYLALPLKPLCRQDCPGLCRRCGARLDAGECGCGPEDPDPRWAALNALKKTLDGS